MGLVLFGSIIVAINAFLAAVLGLGIVYISYKMHIEFKLIAFLLGILGTVLLLIGGYVLFWSLQVAFTMINFNG